MLLGLVEGVLVVHLPLIQEGLVVRGSRLENHSSALNDEVDLVGGLPLTHGIVTLGHKLILETLGDERVVIIVAVARFHQRNFGLSEVFDNFLMVCRAIINWCL